MLTLRKSKLTIEQILLWADQHYKLTGQWPKQTSGTIKGAPAESWSMIESSLRGGCRDLPGCSSLTKLLYAARGVPSSHYGPRLSVASILTWARAHHQRTGKWPTNTAGVIVGVPGESWQRIDRALRNGLRGLRGGGSLCVVLAASRRSTGQHVTRLLTVQQILRWANEHHRRTARWPSSQSGTVQKAPSEKWAAIERALREGYRGLTGGSSLFKLRTQYRSGLARCKSILTVESGLARRKSTLTVEQILAWADKHHARNKRWPIRHSGNLRNVPNMNWRKIDAALRLGLRGLPGESSLSRLLDQHRGVRNDKGAPALIVRDILTWADAHHRRTGAWPKIKSGAVREVPAENWRAINSALYQGSRGLSGGSSLARLLADRRGARNPSDLPKLTVEQILSWADRHFERTGRWPTYESGRVVCDSREAWRGIDGALRRGSRQLCGQSSLARILDEHRHNLAY